MAKNKKGFTIIEVVLVLAIAGLIFLMVFIALPALQRSQRNTRRRQDMARILSAFNDYQSNNNGSVPDSSKITDFMDRYVGDSSSDQRKDPDGTNYTMIYHEFGSDMGHARTECYYDGSSCAAHGSHPSAESSVTHNVHYWPGGECSGTEGTIKKTDGGHNVAIAYYLEGGAIYCGDNR